MTIEIEGRTRYADGPTTTISLRRRNSHEDPVLVIHGGLVEQRDSGEFILGAKHLTATDESHDSAYVAYLEGAGLNLEYMKPHGVLLSGVILKARFYPEAPEPQDVGECDYPSCQDNPHGYLDFTPPKQDWKPLLYEIDVRFVSPADATNG